MEKNLFVKIAFDGSKFHGWQIQQNAYTAQEAFQTALYKIIKEEVDIKACSRTDTGVHAREFCISFKTKSPIPTFKLTGALNHFLPDNMAALSCEEKPYDFHARYSCKGKEYVYEIWNNSIRDPFLKDRVYHYWYDIDEEILNNAAKHYIGTHNFKSFCTVDARREGDLSRTVYDAGVKREGDKIIFNVSANGFLYNMVRIMVGTLIRVREGKIDKDEIPYIIKCEDRAKAGPTAPPQGLYLNKVFY